MITIVLLVSGQKFNLKIIEKKIHIKATEDSPLVEFDSVNSIIHIDGQSLMNDPAEFYLPLIDWLNLFVSSNKHNFSIEIFLKYMNSGSTKYLLKFLSIPDPKANLMSVKWFVKDYDIVMKEKGKELKYLLNMPFEIVIIY